MTDTKIKLPVVKGTSAASTTFCAAELKGPDGRSLWFDGNAKITAANGTYANPKPNAFSLEAQAVSDREGGNAINCPGSTAVCRSSCYVHGLEKHANDTYQLYRQNTAMVREILIGDGPIVGNASKWAWLVANWITDNAAGGFRWHVSGDVYSRQYAKFIATVIKRSPSVGHWIYSRSFWVPAAGGATWDTLEPLLGLPNLALNLSVDRENYAAALQFQGGTTAPTKLCYLTDDGTIPTDLPDGSVIFPDYALRDKGEGSPWFDALSSRDKKMVCPVDLRGKADNRRCGPCAKCLPGAAT